jgi:hypothetical protein
MAGGLLAQPVTVGADSGQGANRFESEQQAKCIVKLLHIYKPFVVSEDNA